MRKTALIAAIAAGLVFSGGVYAIAKSLSITEIEKAKISTIQEAFSYPGENGFSALYALGYDLPQHDRARVLGEDLGAFKSYISKPGMEWNPRVRSYPSLVSASHSRSGWCSFDQSCLSQVASDMGGYASRIDANRVLIEDAASLAQFDSFQTPFPAHHAMPIPEYRPLNTLPTHYALLFNQGQVEQALSGTCNSIKIGRTLMGTSDLLIGTMVGADLARKSAKLLAEMQDELPTGKPLPSECGLAFSDPIDTTGTVCRAILSEGKMVVGSMYDGTMLAAVKQEDLGTHFDPQRTAARMAPTFTWFCEDQVKNEIASGAPVSPAPDVASMASLECLTNYAGCVVSNMASPRYENYARRIQETDAILLEASKRVARK